MKTIIFHDRNPILIHIFSLTLALLLSNLTQVAGIRIFLCLCICILNNWVLYSISRFKYQKDYIFISLLFSAFSSLIAFFGIYFSSDFLSIIFHRNGFSAFLVFISSFILESWQKSLLFPFINLYKNNQNARSYYKIIFFLVIVILDLFLWKILRVFFPFRLILDLSGVSLTTSAINSIPLEGQLSFALIEVFHVIVLLIFNFRWLKFYSFSTNEIFKRRGIRMQN